MNLEFGLVAAALAILVLVAGCVAVSSRLAFPYLRKRLARSAPATRANLLLALAAAPLGAGAVVLVMVLVPSFAHLLGLAADHCHVHGHHGHLCLVHSPLFSGSTLELALLGVSGGLLAGWLAHTVLRLRRSRAALQALGFLTRESSAEAPYRLVQSAYPFALTVGLLRPQVFVSNRLRDGLTPLQFKAVVDHEQSHRQRRDGLRLLLARLVSALYPPRFRQQILDELVLATEQACDEAAAAGSGDRLLVAETILKISRMLRGTTMPCAMTPSVTGADAVLRVECLLRPAVLTDTRTKSRVVYLSAVALAAGLLSSDWWHHRIETLFTLMLG